MVRLGAIALMGLSIVHILVLGSDVPSEFPNWLRLNLWTFEHWQPLRAQPADLALSGGIFWATAGSFAVPMFILGALLFWLDRHGLPIPSFVGWGLVAWATTATLIMPPSGFPAGIVVACLLAVGLAQGERLKDRP